tara:strand:+ start:9737 stop:10306 length:570 start_codon:yes stop_codon:yes gene_type:complete
MQSGLEKLRRHTISVFKNDPVPAGAFYGLVEHLSKSNAETLGLMERCENMDRSGSWDYEDLLSSDSVHIKLLLIPKGSKIPIHDHPKMHVLLKVIWGKMHVQAWDWAREYPFSGFARQSIDATMDGSSQPSMIFPEKNNIHTMSAIEDCAFLDICSPFYDESQGRSCTYYKQEPRQKIGSEWLTPLKKS